MSSWLSSDPLFVFGVVIIAHFFLLQQTKRRRQAQIEIGTPKKNNIENNIYVKSMNLSSSQVVSVFSHAQQGAAQPLDFLLSLYMTVHLPALGRKKNQIKE